MGILLYMTEKVRLFQLGRFDKMKKILIPLFLFWVSIDIHACKKDSLNFVVKSFMVYNIIINSYQVSDADLEWVGRKHPNWIKKYYPDIIKLDCTLYTKFALAIDLYKQGITKELKQLWRKYRYLFYVNQTRASDDEIDEIWQLLDSSQLDIFH